MSATLVVNSTTPSNGASNVPNNQVVTIRTNANSIDGNLDSATVNFTNVVVNPSNLSATISSVGSDITINPNGATWPSNTSITITVTTNVKDTSGDFLSSPYVFIFLIAPAFTVSSTTPTNGATNVANSSNISIVFSNNVDSSTVNSITITSSPAFTAVYSTSSATVTITPSSNLANSTTFTITVTTNVKDIYGQTLSSNYVFSFTTAAAFTVTGNTPANGATNVPNSQVITITFSNNVSGGTVSSSTVTLSPSVGGTTWSTATNVVTVNPHSGLAGSTTYTVTATTSVQDIYGQTLASSFSFSFTTAPALSVVSTNPVNGATNVALNQIATITFSNNLSSGTVNTTNVTISPSVPGYAVTLSPNTVINVNPGGPNLGIGTTYTITVSTSVQDIYGQSLASAFSFSFTTIPPTVLSVTPGNGAGAVLVTTTVTVVMDTTIQSGPVTTANIELIQLPSTTVSTSVALQADNKTIIITPSANLTFGAIFKVIVQNQKTLSSGIIESPNPWDGVSVGPNAGEFNTIVLVGGGGGTGSGKSTFVPVIRNQFHR